MIVWALFDSGNGCYKRSAKKFEEIEIYSIGLDIENKNDHFINLNLADYSYLFGDNTMFETLDKLPKPDLIIASPPCESWSVASAMKNGNASWKQEKGDSLFEPQHPLSRFTVRDYKDYENYQFKPEKSLIKRINGELCIFNTIQIIKKYQPGFYVIENPASSKIWDYVKNILGFELPFENLTYYNNYGYPLSKPTKFKSNVQLGLSQELIRNEIEFRKLDRKGGAYNARSNIPEKLVDEIFQKILKEYKKDSPF
jgi:site-specific DNA-cytosine methylase